MHHLPSRYIPCDGRLTASAYFKSTLPAWGATQLAGVGVAQRVISIRAPRMGSDLIPVVGLTLHLIFQSTLPAWGATVQPKHTAMTA